MGTSCKPKIISKCHSFLTRGPVFQYFDERDPETDRLEEVLPVRVPTYQSPEVVGSET